MDTWDVFYEAADSDELRQFIGAIQADTQAEKPRNSMSGQVMTWWWSGR